jgi:hypothetical protein
VTLSFTTKRPCTFGNVSVQNPKNQKPVSVTFSCTPSYSRRRSRRCSTASSFGAFPSLSPHRHHRHTAASPRALPLIYAACSIVRVRARRASSNRSLPNDPGAGTNVAHIDMRFEPATSHRNPPLFRAKKCDLIARARQVIASLMRRSQRIPTPPNPSTPDSSAPTSRVRSNGRVTSVVVAAAADSDAPSHAPLADAPAVTSPAKRSRLMVASPPYPSHARALPFVDR